MANKRHTCFYCKYWIESDVRKSPAGEVKRRCEVRGRTVKVLTKSCKYFDPNPIFACRHYSERVYLTNCLHRRRNPKQFQKSWKHCLKCRQFEQDILPIIEDYYIGDKTKGILSPAKKQYGRVLKRRDGHPKKRTIRRRPGHEKTVIEKRTIKRRSDHPKKRVLKRRKTDGGPIFNAFGDLKEPKKKRVLKRRKEKSEYMHMAEVVGLDTSRKIKRRKKSNLEKGLDVLLPKKKRALKRRK